MTGFASVARLTIEGRPTIAPLPLARWRSGYAEDCKSLQPGSIPARASTFPQPVRNRTAGVRNRTLAGIAAAFAPLFSASCLEFNRAYGARGVPSCGNQSVGVAPLAQRTIAFTLKCALRQFPALL